MTFHILGTRRILFPLLMIVCFAPIGCGGSREEGLTENTDVVCVSRANLKLIVAAMTRDSVTMESAIQAGADVNTTVEGLGPPIVAAALTDNYPAVKLLLERGANPNASDNQGYTALINASLNNNRDMLQLLLAKGADVNATSYPTINGQRVQLTPLMIAKAKGHADIAKLLIEAGAKE